MRDLIPRNHVLQKNKTRGRAGTCPTGASSRRSAGRVMTQFAIPAGPSSVVCQEICRHVHHVTFTCTHSHCDTSANLQSLYMHHDLQNAAQMSIDINKAKCLGDEHSGYDYSGISANFIFLYKYEKVSS